MKKEPYLVPAVVRSLEILELLGRSKEATFKEIYTRLDIPKTSAYQILTTLEQKKYIRRSGESSTYSLGFKLFELGSLATSSLDIRKEAMPFLRNLVLQTKLTCHLGILDGMEGVYIAKIEGMQPIRLNSWEGKRLPLHSTSIGKVLLAWQKEDDLENILSGLVLSQLTKKTLTDKAALKAHLKISKARGWALDDQENEEHIRCMGAPILNSKDEVIAAISVSGLASHLDGENLIKISELLMETACQISIKIGNRSQKICEDQKKE